MLIWILLLVTGYFNVELIPPLNLMIISVYVLDENAHDVEFSDIFAYI